METLNLKRVLFQDWAAVSLGPLLSADMMMVGTWLGCLWTFPNCFVEITAFRQCHTEVESLGGDWQFPL